MAKINLSVKESFKLPEQQTEENSDVVKSISVEADYYYGIGDKFYDCVAINLKHDFEGIDETLVRLTIKEATYLRDYLTTIINTTKQ